MSHVGGEVEFKLHLLQAITNNFSEDRKIGGGPYGDVYRAVYDGKEIAVKKLHQLQGLDDKAFDNEFFNLSNVHHPNVVPLIGYCHETHRHFHAHKGRIIPTDEQERVLCFEYVQGGSLDKHISEESCDLDWPTCYRIIRGICEGLNHLHTGEESPIYHLDLKPDNILLDKNMTAKIGDLGLSRLVASTETRKTEMRKGTNEFMPPEYLARGYVTKKFDVFSLGVIIIKIMAGNRGYSRRFDIPQQFIHRVEENWKKRLQGKLSSVSQEIIILHVKICVKMALRCVEADPKRRPGIKEISNELENLEAEVIKRMSLSSNLSKDLTGQRSFDSSVVAVNPSLELRFLFEPRKDISCCLQLTNKTDGFIAYNIKTNPTNYYTKPSKGIMLPCSSCYISVTLRAQEEPPPNMQCHDILLVQSFRVSGHLTTDEITKNLFKAMAQSVVDVVNLPIAYIALDLYCTKFKMSHVDCAIDFKLFLLQDITNNFSDDQKIGGGHYGDVYRATYNGKEIAVKRLHHLNELDDKAFQNELRNLSKIRHENVVQLIGYCYESRHKHIEHNGKFFLAQVMERVLCFEYMHGGSLDEHISEESCDLDWPTCYRIIKGVCEGLNHLHTSYEKPIFHLDLKPANILLDKNMTAKIGDVGLPLLVYSTTTYGIETSKGTLIRKEWVSSKLDVFSLGVIIMNIMAGSRGYDRHNEMAKGQFIELVTENWKESLQGKFSYSSQEIDILRVKTCAEIALRCVEADQIRRPFIEDIINELENLEAEIIKTMSLSSSLSKDLTRQRSFDSSVVTVDPSGELCFLFEPRKDISCCLQLTNKTDGFVAYNIKTNPTKYYTDPSKGIMPPCSRCYISVTLRAQEEAPPNMQCHDTLLVQSFRVSEHLTMDEITEDFFKKTMPDKVVDVVTLPIVLVALDL